MYLFEVQKFLKDMFCQKEKILDGGTQCSLIEFTLWKHRCKKILSGNTFRTFLAEVQFSMVSRSIKRQNLPEDTANVETIY